MLAMLLQTFISSIFQSVGAQHFSAERVRIYFPRFTNAFTGPSKQATITILSKQYRFRCIGPRIWQLSEFCKKVLRAKSCSFDLCNNLCKSCAALGSCAIGPSGKKHSNKRAVVQQQWGRGGGGFTKHCLRCVSTMTFYQQTCRQTRLQSRLTNKCYTFFV
jgi:hypothetical protein